MSGELFPRERREVAPGAVHLPDWLSPERQRELLAACREWARPPAGLRTVRTRTGVMSVKQVCLGWHWGPVPRCPRCGKAGKELPAACPRHAYPYAYDRTVVDGDGAPVKAFPAWLGEWARQAVADAFPGEREPGGDPFDIALVNFYDAHAHMGMHQDSDERSPAPVVSFSLGDTCVFRFGTPAGRGRPWTDTDLLSGDAFVFGGPSRLAYHGVPRTRPGSGPAELGLTGRVNVTVRVAGFD
ncbi:alpha-ketoglutarate-dependent dioxygenase AlkB family protein [Streptomyces litchfieldiae]|uniref:Alpha-ketoglutarate-dependent dioxygenase AlkB n=1 Tax=Streptomyces litchfieldiae TaxID=3075543 RepID=A0ABU2MRR1_9ACTN|nr:alpha-ketoglutarate-dependent dioxygenase AlkB [Streptomyces sp. DSM 44938]MDT0344313.1 alpha-ketoglutarate-dependent dioxygenase AlkB [Streptomyces sp. DSM 44938]